MRRFWSAMWMVMAWFWPGMMYPAGRRHAELLHQINTVPPRALDIVIGPSVWAVNDLSSWRLITTRDGRLFPTLLGRLVAMAGRAPWRYPEDQ